MMVRHMPDWLLPVRPSASTGWVPFASPKPQAAENLFANLPEHPSLLLFSYISRLSGSAQKHQQGARTMYPKALPRALHSCRPGSMSTLKATLRGPSVLTQPPTSWRARAGGPQGGVLACLGPPSILSFLEPCQEEHGKPGQPG